LVWLSGHPADPAAPSCAALAVNGKQLPGAAGNCRRGSFLGVRNNKGKLESLPQVKDTVVFFCVT